MVIMVSVTVMFRCSKVLGLGRPMCRVRIGIWVRLGLGLWLTCGQYRPIVLTSLVHCKC